MLSYDAAEMVGGAEADRQVVPEKTLVHRPRVDVLLPNPLRDSAQDDAGAVGRGAQLLLLVLGEGQARVWELLPRP